MDNKHLAELIRDRQKELLDLYERDVPDLGDAERKFFEFLCENLDQIIEALESEDWISTEDELPPEGESVETRCIGMTFDKSADSFTGDFTVTHWRKIPIDS